jgi:hypothetical protein
MADPVISNIPTSFTSDQATFLQDVKASVEFLLGHGRNLAANRALRVGELANMGIDINAFLHGTPQSPHLPFESIPSGDMPDPPTGLLIQKGLFSHTLTWTNPTDTNVSHIEVWVAVNSQNIIDASLIAIVTVTPDLRGGEGKYINAGFDVTADMTYWIRSVSYGDVYSEWHPTLVMGGVAVAGDESVSETIDGVINLLKGGTSELYSDVTVYSLYERCRTADGRVWESISIADHSGNQPPNATYWKRAGILMTGDVDGVPTAAIDGNLVVDDTILARHIQAGSIVAEHMAANQVLVGHTIKSDNFSTGVSGWQIDGIGGTAEFNNITMTLSYSNVTGGPPADADKTANNPQSAAWLTDAGALATLSSIDLSYVTDAGALAGINPDALVYASTTAPADPSANPLWVDTSGTPTVLKRWTGTAWEVISTLNTGALADVDSADWSSQVVGVGKPQDYADVTGQNTANDVLTGAGKAVAEHGADVTGQNTAYDTARIDGYNSAIIRQGSRTGIVNGFENSEIGDWSSVSQNTDSYSGTYAGLFTSTNTAPASSGTTGEPYITIPEEIALAFAGKRIKVSIIAKQPASGASSEFAVAYSTSDVGNSLWHYFTPTTSWQVFTFTYDVPEPNSGGTDFLGIWGDTSGGGNGVLVDNLQISMNQKESEFNALDLQNAPAEAGADVTANNTANDTSNVNGLPSANVSGWAHPTDRTTIHGGQIYTGTVTAQQIAAGTITAAEIAAGSITAESGVVGSLDADKITTGTLSAGSVKISSTDGKTYFLDNALCVYDANNQLRVKIGQLS